MVEVMTDKATVTITRAEGREDRSRRAARSATIVAGARGARRLRPRRASGRAAAGAGRRRTRTARNGAHAAPDERAGGDGGRRHQGDAARDGLGARDAAAGADRRRRRGAGLLQREAARDAGDAQARARAWTSISARVPPTGPAGPRDARTTSRRFATRRARAPRRARPSAGAGARARRDGAAPRDAPVTIAAHRRAGERALEERVPFAGMRRKDRAEDGAVEAHGGALHVRRGVRRRPRSRRSARASSRAAEKRRA